MQSQQFYVKAGDNDMASYQVIIPVLNMQPGYSVHVKAEDGTDVPCKPGESGEYIIDREDRLGQFKVTVAIKDPQGKVCDERLVEISCAKGTDPKVMRAVVSVLERQPANAMLVGNAFSDVHAKARGEDIAAVCELYFRSDVTADWRQRCLAYLQAAMGSAFVKGHAAEIMGVISHALGTGESAGCADHPLMAVSIGLRANVPPSTKFPFLFRALQCSLPNVLLYRDILSVMATMTPTSERPKVAAVATELLARHAEFDLRLKALNLIVACGHRNALPTIRDVLTSADGTGMYGYALHKRIVEILRSWNDTASAPMMMEVLDLTNDSSLAGEIIRKSSPMPLLT